uniref:Uncharacterized protein n=1 Tax=Myotis myotis TaxID=51298 RepID=A0A7J7UCT1_MYOMY|nr:hypothetical protein mMyoMyo1_008739 [Myotis myotis]
MFEIQSPEMTFKLKSAVRASRVGCRSFAQLQFSRSQRRALDDGPWNDAAYFAGFSAPACPLPCWVPRWWNQWEIHYLLPSHLFFFFFLQRGREKDRELETSMRNIDQLPPAHLPLGMCPQPRYMPLTGIEPGTFQSTGRRSIHPAKPVSALLISYWVLIV